MQQHRIKKWFGSTGAAALLALAAIMSSPSPCRTETCGPVPHDTASPDPQGFFSVPSPTVCREGELVVDQTIPDGGLVKVDTLYRFDTEAHVTGTCDYNTWNYWPPPGWCQYFFTDTRWLALIGLTRISPSNNSQYQPLYASSHTQSLDTRPSTNGVTYIASELGRYTHNFQSTAYSTACNEPPYSAVVSRHISALTCEPLWLRGSTIIHQQPGNVDLYIPPDMYEQLREPAEAAASVWTSALGGIVQIHATQEDCGSLPTCIRIQQGVVSSGCAIISAPVYDSAGIVTSGRTITLPTAPDPRIGTYGQQNGFSALSRMSLDTPLA